MAGNTLKHRPLSPAVVFLLFFSYATAAALLFQKFMLPLVASAHHAQGLIQGDSAYFQAIAVELAERIRQHGWSEWRGYSAIEATGNVALLGALYALFGIDPSLIVPINAAIHALSGTLLFVLGRMIWPGRVGLLAGMAASTLFVIFPSALNWYGQIHKDGFAIAGTLLVLMSWTISETGSLGRGRVVAATAAALAGVALIVFVRPYSLILIFCGVLVMFFLRLTTHREFRGRLDHKHPLLLQLMLVALIGVATFLTPHTGAEEQSYSRAEVALGWTWKSSSWIPQGIEKYVEVLARTRAGLIEENLKIQAGSLYDFDALPASTSQVVAYAPRALQIALFAPFPSRWFEKLSVTRLVAVGETVIWYLIAPGLLLALWFARSRSALSVAVFAMALLTVYGITLANVGTLYRIRYPYLFMLMLIGS